MTDGYYVASEGVLGLRTNSPNVKWSWGVNMPPADRDQYDACAVRIRYSVLGDEDPIPSSDSATFGKYHYFYAEPLADVVHYKRKFVGRRYLYLRVSGLIGGEIHVEVNSDYAKFITHRFMNLHSPGYVLTDIVGWALVQQGFAPVHCSGFAIHGETVLVLAPPNTGKTLTTMVACMDLGARYLAEDVAITDGIKLFGVPWTSTFRYYESLDNSRRTRALHRLTNVFPVAELLPVAKSSRIDDLLGKSQILSSSPISQVAVLERHDQEGVIPLSDIECAEKGTNLNRYEFKYSVAPVMVAYEYFNPEVRIADTQAKEFDLLRKAIAGAKDRYVVRTRDASRYAHLIVDHVKK